MICHFCISLSLHTANNSPWKKQLIKASTYKILYLIIYDIFPSNLGHVCFVGILFSFCQKENSFPMNVHNQ